MCRYRAFAFHFFISVIVSLVVLVFVLNFWYPHPLQEVLGVFDILVLILFVDVCIGPLLTLFVYRAGKPGLCYDMAVIAVLQLLALVYGVCVVAQGRPVWIVFSVDRFEVVQSFDVDWRNKRNVPVFFLQEPWLGPEWVFAELPKDISLRNELLLESAFGGSDLSQRPEFYRSLRQHWPSVEKKIRPLSELYDFNAASVVDAELKKFPDADGWLPLAAREITQVVLLNNSERRILTVVALRPWR